MPKNNPVDHATMREMNVSLILNTLRLHAPISRAGLAAMTGLNKATVSNMVRDLLANRFIREIGVDTSSTEVGRPAINLELNPDAGYILSVEIGVDFIVVIATDFTLNIVERRYESTLELQTQEAILNRVIALLKETYSAIQTRGRTIFGLGVCVPGIVDMETGTLLFAPNLRWRNVPLRDLMAAEFDLPIYIANEANMAALGESYFGTAQHCDLLLYVGPGVGIGGGIVINGRLLTGATGFAGEIGHMILDPDGIVCNCGSVGCWETLGSQQSVFRHIQNSIKDGQDSSLMKATGGNLNKLTVPMVVKAAEAGDSVACQALENVGYWLGVGLVNLINIFNPQCIVFGGSLSQAHQFLLPVMQAEVKRRALSREQTNADIVIARHVADAAVMGGVAMVHHEIINHPAHWLLPN